MPPQVFWDDRMDAEQGTTLFADGDHVHFRGVLPDSTTRRLTEQALVFPLPEWRDALVQLDCVGGKADIRNGLCRLVRVDSQTVKVTVQTATATLTKELRRSQLC